jgi:hypothetical protein
LAKKALVPVLLVQTKQMIISAKILSNQNFTLDTIDDLTGIEYSVFSQWGEDGIIDWLIGKLPGIPKTFVEFGVESYVESNTRYLLYSRNWCGFIIDGDATNIEKIKSQDIYWRVGLQAKHAFIDRENINELIESSGMRGDIGLLSVDIDGNDYWVWEAITIVNPAIVVCEYNAVFGINARVSVPYQADFQRTNAHYSNLYFGASIAALIELGDSKGYTFVGTNSNGCNAFFVRKDLSQPVVSSLGSIVVNEANFSESRDSTGGLTFLKGDRRLVEIGHLPVFDFETQTIRTLADHSSVSLSGQQGTQ